jgi:hypothetical protein
MVKRKQKPRLPRVSVLAVSEKQLRRFSEAMEQGIALVGDLMELVGRLTRAAQIIDARHAAAKKANATRRQNVDQAVPYTAPIPGTKADRKEDNTDV